MYCKFYINGFKDTFFDRRTDKQKSPNNRIAIV